MKKMMSPHPMTNTIKSTLVVLPTPTSISYMWNWGSMLGVNLGIQIITGVLLASHYNPSVDLAFDSMAHISREVYNGYLLRFMHMNGASLFFVLMFIHISRGINQSSYNLAWTWASGVTIILILMGTAFLGYVLPWGQMSFWGATVITNLLSAVPFIGSEMVQWLWGGFSIGMATLNRFFTLHFLLPFVLTAMVVIHLTSLHQSGSNLPNGMNPDTDKILFHPYFSTKDMMTLFMMAMILFLISMMSPLSGGDPENFNPANPLNTPPHIQPEWYFLFAYAILRSIPNKLGGVIALIMSIMSLILLTATKTSVASKKFLPIGKEFFWGYSALFIILTYIGACPVEEPFEIVGKVVSVLYFYFLLMN